MSIIIHTIGKNTVKLEIKQPYTSYKKIVENAAILHSHGFFLNKVRRTWKKNYFDSEIINDMFNRDLEMLKSLFPYYKIITQKIISVESNVKGISNVA